MPASVRVSTKILFAFFFFMQFMSAIYAAWQSDMPTVSELLSPLAFAWLCWWWLRDDSRDRGITWPIDLGMFVYVGWFLILPYHLLKTRGIKGLLGIAAFIAVAFAAWVAASAFVVLVWY
jgi:hypothetical protein